MNCPNSATVCLWPSIMRSLLLLRFSTLNMIILIYIWHCNICIVHFSWARDLLKPWYIFSKIPMFGSTLSDTIHSNSFCRESFFCATWKGSRSSTGGLTKWDNIFKNCEKYFAVFSCVVLHYSYDFFRYSIKVRLMPHERAKNHSADSLTKWELWKVFLQYSSEYFCFNYIESIPI